MFSHASGPIAEFNRPYVGTIEFKVHHRSYIAAALRATLGSGS